MRSIVLRNASHGFSCVRMVKETSAIQNKTEKLSIPYLQHLLPLLSFEADTMYDGTTKGINTGPYLLLFGS